MARVNSREVEAAISNVLNTAKQARRLSTLINTNRKIVSPKYFYGEDYRSLPTFYERAEPHRDKLWLLVREVRDNPSEINYQNLDDLLADIRTGTRIPDRHIFWPNTTEIRYRLPNGFDIFSDIPTDEEVFINPALRDVYLNLMLLRNNLTYLPAPTSDMVRTSLQLSFGVGPKTTIFNRNGVRYYPGNEDGVLHVNVLPGDAPMSREAIVFNNNAMNSLPTGTSISAYNDVRPLHYLRERGKVSDEALRDFIVHGNTQLIPVNYYDEIHSTNIALELGKLASLFGRIHIPALGSRLKGFNGFGHTIPGIKDKIYHFSNGWDYPGVELDVNDPKYQAFIKRFDIIKSYPEFNGKRMVDLDGNEYLRDAAAYHKRVSPFFDINKENFSLEKIVNDNRVDEYNTLFGNDYHYAITFDEAGNPIYPYVNVLTLIQKKGGKMKRLIPRLKR